MTTIPPRSGVAFTLERNDKLTVCDPRGEQVSDLFCFSRENPKEYLSTGRTIDYLSKIYLKKGDTIYSSHSRPLLTIEEDDVNSHDILLTPCSKHTFEKLYDNEPLHPGCEGNLQKAFAEYGINWEGLPSTLNLFMNVQVTSPSGEIKIGPPRSKPGDKVVLKALEPLIVGLTACSAPQSNNFNCTEIQYSIDKFILQ